MPKKRILQIAHAYYNRGGVEEHIKTLASELEDHYDIYTLAPVSINRDIQQYQLLFRGIPMLQWNGPHISWPCAEVSDPTAQAALIKTLQLIRPNIIHIQHLLHWPLNAIEIISATKIPSVMSFHDYFIASPQYTLEFTHSPREELSKEYSVKVFGQDISAYLNERRKYFIRHMSTVQKRVVPSDFAKKAMSLYLPSEYISIPHGISSFTPRRFTSPSTKLRFGYIGSLLRQKGISHLIGGFMKAADENQNIELHIYGGGPEENRIPEHPQIIRHKRYKPKNLARILSEFDIGIIPSIFRETFCYTLSELQLGGKPALCSRIGALAERIVEEENGLLYTAGSEEDLAQKIQWCYHNKEHTWNVEPPKSTDAMAKDYHELYEHIS